jgi:hypothetical protein
MMKDKLFHKSFGLKAAAGSEVTPEILARINSFALKPRTAEEMTPVGFFKHL